MGTLINLMGTLIDLMGTVINFMGTLIDLMGTLIDLHVPQKIIDFNSFKIFNITGRHVFHGLIYSLFIHLFISCSSIFVQITCAYFIRRDVWHYLCLRQYLQRVNIFSNCLVRQMSPILCFLFFSFFFLA